MFYISKLFHHTSLWGIFHLSVCPSIWNSFGGHTFTIQCQRIKRFLKLNFCCCYHFPPIFDGKSMRSLFARDPLHRAGAPRPAAGTPSWSFYSQIKTYLIKYVKILSLLHFLPNIKPTFLRNILFLLESPSVLYNNFFPQKTLLPVKLCDSVLHKVVRM